ncbi:phage tail protein [Xenorhabdus sp. TH1]|uniref:phage tail protein n=1 Tax=Xenorhabdus sp. TH1 TaxID=3130166 RepID=UPI0030CD5026
MQDKKPESKTLEDNVIIVPTPQYIKYSIKEAINEHAKSRNHPYATQTEPGFVTLSNEIDSDNELTVATSQAVKKAYDLANTANQNALNNNSNLYLEKKQNGADIPDKSAFVNNIGLADSVYRTIGNGPNQIPDMNSFRNILGTSGVQYFPGGLIIQWGRFDISSTFGIVETIEISFPVAFPTAFGIVQANIPTRDPSQRSIGVDIANSNRMKVRFSYISPTSNLVFWFAIGY